MEEIEESILRSKAIFFRKGQFHTTGLQLGSGSFSDKKTYIVAIVEVVGEGMPSPDNFTRNTIDPKAQL